MLNWFTSYLLLFRQHIEMHTAGEYIIYARETNLFNIPLRELLLFKTLFFHVFESDVFSVLPHRISSFVLNQHFKIPTSERVASCSYPWYYTINPYRLFYRKVLTKIHRDYFCFTFILSSLSKTTDFVTEPARHRIVVADICFGLLRGRTKAVVDI